MFAGFDPDRAAKPYFQRHRGPALTAAIAVHVLVALLIVWIEMNAGDEEILDAALVEPEIENLDIEEEPEEEELEVEEEPEPEPEPEKPKPKPKNELQNVKQQTQDVSESDVAPEREPEPEAEPEPEPEPEKPEPEAEPEKPKKKKPKVDVGDREKPRPMPADGTPPKPEKGNKAPAYPESLRKQNITGVIKVKLNIHMDGSVRGMKVLAKKIAGTDDPEAVARAQKLFLNAVVGAVKTWKFKPAKLKGKTITVWWPVTIPFSLN